MAMKLLAAVGGYDRASRIVNVIASTPNPTLGFDDDGNPIQEALVGWDTERFRKNPIILWMHDRFSFPVGKAIAYEELPDGGLKMTIQLRSQGRSEQVDELAGLLEDDMIRAVSVSFEPGASTKNADGSWTRRNNNLLEVSFVTVPADEDAGTPELNPEAADDDEEEAQRKRVSTAASELGKHAARARQARAVTAHRADADDTVLRLDTSKLGKLERTPSGGARIPSRLTRTGVLVYRNPDGSTRRELRLPEEVFRADSLATLRDAPVIDIKDHTGLVTPETWKRVSLGHVSEPRRDGNYVASDLVVQDAGTLSAIDSGERTEISVGYRCRIDMTSGVYQGTPYDCIQRDITYNHAALCPPNRGRAGPDVGLRLDTDNDNGAPAWAIANTHEGKATMFKVRMDGIDIELGSETDVARLEAIKAAALKPLQDKLDAKSKELEDEKEKSKKELDEEKGAREAAEEEVKKLRTAEEERAKKADEEDEEERKVSRSRSLRLVRTLVRTLKLKGVRIADDEEEKLDSMLSDLLSKGDAASAERALKVEAIRADAKDFDDKGKSDDYVDAYFDRTLAAAKAARSIGGVTRELIVEQARRGATVRTDATDDDPVTAARKRHDEWAANAWKTQTA